jgi:hypothetical protein
VNRPPHRGVNLWSRVRDRDKARSSLKNTGISSADPSHLPPDRGGTPRYPPHLGVSEAATACQGRLRDAQGMVPNSQGLESHPSPIDRAPDRPGRRLPASPAASLPRPNPSPLGAPDSAWRHAAARGGVGHFFGRFFFGRFFGFFFRAFAFFFGFFAFFFGFFAFFFAEFFFFAEVR